MHPRPASCLALLGLLLCVAPVLRGVTTGVIVHSDYATLSGGECEAVALSNEGWLAPAPVLEKIARLEGSSAIWATASAPDGTLYIAAGNDTAVFRMRPGAAPEKIFSPREALVRALAVSPDGALFVGTSPGGRLYRWKDGATPELYHQFEESYLWALRHDAEGRLLVATGDKGRLYRLAPDHRFGDKAEKLFETDNSHVSVVNFDPQGRLHVATSGRAALYRVEEGQPGGLLLYQAASDEITQLHSEGDSLLLATFSRASQNPESGPAANLPPGPPQASSLVPPDKAALIRLNAEGFAQTAWQLPGVNLFAMQRRQGEWPVGSDREGQLFSLATPQSWRLLQRTRPGGLISALVPEKDGAFLVLTSNPAVVYRLHAAPPSSLPHAGPQKPETPASQDKDKDKEEDPPLPRFPRFVSPVADATQMAAWGRLHAVVYGGGDLQWETRTGNTARPDKTWSDWTPVDATRRVASPPARYLQYRASWHDPRTVLASVRLHYRIPNAAPVVESLHMVREALEILSIKPPPQPVLPQQVFGMMSSEMSPEQMPRQQARPLGRTGWLSLGWRASDPTGDALLYTVEMQRLGETTWATLIRDIEENMHSFPTHGFAPGYYRFRVIASDRPSNTPETALQGERLTQPVLVDNEPPVLSLVEKQRTGQTWRLVLRAEDAHSLLASASYTLNGGKPVALLPEDGLFDDLAKTFVVTLPDSGAHTLLFRASDANDNQAVREIRLSEDG